MRLGFAYYRSGIFHFCQGRWVRSCGPETWLAIGLVLIRGDIVYPRASVTAYHVIAALQFISELLGIIGHLRYSPHNLGANRSRPHRRESWRMRSAHIRFLYSASDRSRCAAADASAVIPELAILV